MIRKYYKRLLSKIIFRKLYLEDDWTETCSMITFENLGNSIGFLFGFVFFSSDIYLGGRLLGYFYGRSWGFFGATNCVCCIGNGRIKFKNACGGIHVINVRTRERLLLKAPRHRIASRITGRIIVRLADNSEMSVHFPRAICLSQIGLPTYAKDLSSQAVLQLEF